MKNSIRVKICGIRNAADLKSVVSAGAAYVGFVRYEPSPRHISIEAAGKLAAAAQNLKKVVLTVNANDRELKRIFESIRPDIIQFHGSESPHRIDEVRRRFGCRTLKAIGIRREEDLWAIDEFSDSADQLLIDAKPPTQDDLPGGNGVAFDWNLLKGRTWPVPWMLAGGLNPDNVGDAISSTGANQVDVSSGVETAPGIKSPKLIADFMQAANRSHNEF